MVTSKSLSYRVTTILIYLFLLLAAFISLAPLVNTVAMSFSSSGAASAGKVNFIPVEFTLSAYKKIMNDTAFWQAFWVSIQRVVLGGVINLSLVVLMAFPLSRTTKQFKYRNIYMWILMFTMLFSGGTIPTYMVVTEMGLINTIWALILPGAVSVYNVILMMNFFRNIPGSLEEAALIDGASPWTVLFKIFLPISLPSLATITLFIVVGHWNSFFDGLIYINDQTKIPLQTYLQQLSLSTELMKEATVEEMKNIKDLSSLTLNSAKILVSMVPILIIYPFLQRFLVSGLVLGSVKE